MAKSCLKLPRQLSSAWRRALEDPASQVPEGELPTVNTLLAAARALDKLQRAKGDSCPSARAVENLSRNLEPHLAQLNVTFADVVPALLLVDTVAEIKSALSDPKGFLQRLLESQGPAAKRFLIDAKVWRVQRDHLRNAPCHRDRCGVTVVEGLEEHDLVAYARLDERL